MSWDLWGYGWREGPEPTTRLAALPDGLHIQPEDDDWVAYHQGQPVGSLSVDYSTEVPSIDSIRVHPDYRRHGIGKALWEAAGRPAHTPDDMSADGQAWARAVGGPRLAMPENYWGGHRPGGPEHGAPFHDLNQMWGEDIYDHPEWYDSMDYGIKDIQRQLNQARGNPEHPVVIYRAMPSGKTDIRTGDWVTTSLPYAREHAIQNDNPDEDWPVVQSTVPAKHVWTNNDLHEWGYHGPNVRGEIVHPTPNKEARIMSAAVTVYTQPNCIQCTMTKKQLDKLGIEHDTVDVSSDPEAHAYVTGLGYTAAPVVVVNDGESHWSGFKPDRLKGLAE